MTKTKRFISTLLAKTKQDKALLVCLMLIGYALIISTSAVLSVKGPIGSDTYWHVYISTFLAKGDIAGGANYILSQNLFPYGFIISTFHFSEVPLVWTGNPLLFVRILEIFFLPATYALTLYLVYKHGGGSKPAAITGLALLGCWAFMDGALQVRPESIDLLLYPITILALLTYKKKTVLLASVLTVYNHGIAGLSAVYGIAIKKIKDKRWTKTIVLTLLLITPVLIVSVYYVGGAFEKWGGAPPQENAQEYELITNPLVFIPAYGGATLLSIPFLFRRNRTELETLLLYGLAGSTVMLALWPDRWMQYASIPLSIFVGIGTSKLKNKWLLATMGGILLTLFMFYFITFMQLSFTSTWWQPEPTSYFNTLFGHPVI